MLMGTYEHRLDSKARLVLPAKIREKLGDAVVVAAGLDKCVSIYSEEEWVGFSEKIILTLSGRVDAQNRVVMTQAGAKPCGNTPRAPSI